MQLLERDAGDITLYNHLVNAYRASFTSKTGAEVEEELWHALRASVQTVTKSKEFNLVLVVDGLDEVIGGEKVQKHICEHLHQLTSKYGNARLVVFSQKLPWAASASRRQLTLNADLVRPDINKMIRAELQSCKQYARLNNTEKDHTLDWILDHAKDSFIWASLAWMTSKTDVDQKNDIRLVEKTPKALPDLLEKLFKGIDFTHHGVKQLFSWLLISERPLTVTEVQDLLKINVQTRTIDSYTYSHKEIEAMCGPSVVIENAIVRFRHSTIRDFFIQKAKEGKLLQLNEAHKDLTLRLLLFVKLRLTRHFDVSFDTLEKSTVDDVFRNHLLLEYAIRYWAIHFRHSSLVGSKGEVIASSDLKSVFPESTFFTLLEWACWESQTSIVEAFNLHELTLRIRQSVFGERHSTVLQMFIIVALFHEKLAEKREAGVCYYRASKIGQVILRKHSVVTVQCTQRFILCVESFSFTSRTEIATFKEEMLKYLIDVHSHQHGANCDLVIRHKQALAALYLSIHEESLATKIYHEIYTMTIRRFGKSSEQAKKVSDELTVVIKKDEQSEDLERFTTSIFETAEETLEVWDRRRIEITIRRAEAFVVRGKFFEAEELYVMLWRRITEVCRTKGTVDMHILKIDIALSYTEFLRQCKRTEEASSILMVIWSEYEQSMHGSELIAIRLKKIGQIMKTIGLLTVAVSVFAAVWGWFKKNGKADHEEARSTTVLISETVEEEITRTITTKTTTTTTVKTTTTISEETMREVYAVTYERCKHSKNHTEIMKATTALVTLYIHEEKWSLAVETITKTLELTWKVLIVGDGKLTLPTESVSQSIEISIRLALSYHKLQQYEKAERIYLRLYHACRASLKIEDERVSKTALILIQFYEEYHRHEQAIQIYRELLVEYRKHLGATHATTIRTLYAIGALCISYGFKSGYEYYQEIVTVLNKGHKHCHKDAFEAAVILCRYYREEQRWAELKTICEVLWESFVHHHSEYKFTEELIITIYTNYIYVLEHYTKADYSLLYMISVQFRETVIKIFGASSTIAITATIELAKICERHESRYHEAVTLYEEVIKKTTTITTTTNTTTVTAVSTTIIEEVRRRLTRTYIKVIHSGSSSSTSTATVERAISLLLERFNQFKVQYGCYHETTLTELRELMLLYKKQNTKETHAIVVRTLQTTVVEVVSKETISSRLFQAAVTIANIYLACELPEHGFEILRMLRRQIIYKDTSGCSFTLPAQVGKISYVFLVAFEETLLRKKTVSYTEIMVDLLTETFLYEQYTKILKTDRIETTFKFGAQLRSFLVIRKRDQQVKMLDDQLFEVFLKRYGSTIKTKRETTFLFYELLLVEFGREDRHEHNLADAACLASNNKVHALIEAGHYAEAYEVALCAFQFLSSQGAYRHLHNIGYGFKLSLYLAGREVHGKGENKHHAEMMELSRVVIQEVFSACKEQNINFVQLKLEDLDALVGLLGEQQNYQNLEVSPHFLSCFSIHLRHLLTFAQILLSSLWKSRTVQKTWSRSTLLRVGRSLIYALFAHKHHDAAIHLAEDIMYNLRRTLGPLDPQTRGLYLLLSSLYTGAQRHRDAMGLHEEVLRLVLYGDEESEEELKDIDLPEIARVNLELLKRTYQRLGEFDKSPETYRYLYEDLLKEFPDKIKSVGPIDKWAIKGPADNMGAFAVPQRWEIIKKRKGATTTAAANGSADAKKEEIITKMVAMEDEEEEKMQKKRPSALQRARKSWGFRNFFGGEE